ncbi:MAG TPA: VWD domain-containing protein, partial [Silvibacterium sp.]|nr:VWD domain-containing protein [Silvibacterium sp.]
MRSHGLLQSSVVALLGRIVTAAVLFTLLGSSAVSAVSQTPNANATQTGGSDLGKAQDAWHQSLLRLPHPKPGCYKASYPRIEWIAAPCGAPPKYPVQPAHGPAKHFIVGNGGANDFASHPSSGTITGVDGTFPTINAGLTESGPIANSGPSFSDTYTLQINTNQFSSAACAGSPNPNCKGWEQFVYENNPSTHDVFIQYWLIQYNAACPGAAWTQFQFTGSSDIYCFQSTGTSSMLAGHPVSDFDKLTFSASVTPSSDQVVMRVGADVAMISGINAVDVAAGWVDAEFNAFGDAGNSSGGGQAGFGASSTITVKNTVHNGTRNAPACDMQSFTGETNNLTLVGMAPIGTQPSPAIEFTESNVLGTAAACVTAAVIGDTHLTTFGGLLYDFQAEGDFVLAQSGKNFIVENRQVSGAPTWPNAAVNKAVATRMGNTRVAVCTSPSRLVVDGRDTQIADGQILSLPGGVGVLHTGNIFLVQDDTGNSLRAEDMGTYINATVGLGRWPAAVTGVLANAKNNVLDIAARTGAVLTAPFNFNQLYHE